MLHKKPGTSEFLDWLRALYQFEQAPRTIEDVSAEGQDLLYPELLFKLRMDWLRYHAEADGRGMSDSHASGSPWQRIRRLFGREAVEAAAETLSDTSDAPAARVSDPDVYELLTEVFARLRAAGFNLGVAELMAAFRALEGGWGNDGLDDLAVVAKLIWCDSRQEEGEFDLYWEQLAPTHAPRGDAANASSKRAAKEPSTADDERRTDQTPSDRPLGRRREMPTAAGLSALPVRTPYLPVPQQHEAAVRTHWPLARRNMLYAWRYLRRPVPDGPADVLDVRATVNRAAHQGYYLAPVYRRRERNYAHLVLLVDQGGSMAPLHRFTRDLVETVIHESSLEAVEIYYFHNVPGDVLFADPHMTARISSSEVFNSCGSETSVLIVSDAGAARGVRYLPRMQATARFLAELKLHTTLVAWLNPMPPARWQGNTAQMINAMVEMFPMNPDGMAGAIDVLRGQG